MYETSISCFVRETGLLMSHIVLDYLSVHIISTCQNSIMFHEIQIVLHWRSVSRKLQRQMCNEITSIAKPRDLGIRPSHERFRCTFPARAIYLHLCGNKDHGRYQ